MKKVISAMAIAAFLFAANVNAQEKQEKKECSKKEMKSCSKDKKADVVQEKKWKRKNNSINFS